MGRRCRAGDSDPAGKEEALAAAEHAFFRGAIRRVQVADLDVSFGNRLSFKPVKRLAGLRSSTVAEKTGGLSDNLSHDDASHRQKSAGTRGFKSCRAFFESFQKTAGNWMGATACRN